MSTKRTALQLRNDTIEGEERSLQHQTKHIPNNALKIKLDHLKTLNPLTDNQAKFFDMYKRGDYCIGVTGSAGTGKTLISLYKALEEVLSKDNPFKSVVVVRSCVPTRDVGFLPGDLEEKSEIYQLPYIEACSNLFGRPDAWDRLKEQGYARFLTTTAIRGISIDDSIIIVDEMQNFNWGEINTIMGRIGHRSKIIFCGDFRQNDLTKNRNDVSAFHDFVKVARRMSSFTEIYYTPDDIVRSSLTKEWIVSCESFDDIGL
jgi:phosphate starvation-inducible PhoH-like protein